MTPIHYKLKRSRHRVASLPPIEFAIPRSQENFAAANVLLRRGLVSNSAWNINP